MPSKNIIKEYSQNSYYHIYSRGANKQKLFNVDADYKHFLKLFERYLSEGEMVTSTGEIYPSYFGEIEIISYCLMPNHFHLLIYQTEAQYIEKFMRSVMTSYSRYFNLKYKHTGPVFESRYKAVRIDNEFYLQHITRYIHLNPRLWQRHKYSSLKYYRDGCEPDWLSDSKVLELFSSRQEYLEYITDYEETNSILHEVKDQLVG